MRIKRDITIEEVFGEFRECFKTLCIKCLALRENGEWLNIMMTGFLSMKDEELLRDQITKEYEQLERLGVTRLEKLLITYDIREATDFLQVVQNILSGSITLRGQVITLGENVRGSIEEYSHLLSQDNFPKISFIASVDGIVAKGRLSTIEESLMSFGYRSIDELGLQWLMLPDLRAYTFSVIIDIPIYFIPLSLSLDGNEIRFNAISHKSFVNKLRLRLTLKKLFAGKAHVPVENYAPRFQATSSSDDVVTVTITQPLESALNHEDIVEVVVTSRLGILCEKSEKVTNLLQKEVVVGDFPKLITQFIGLDGLEALLKGEKQAGDAIPTRKPELSFQRAVAWFLSILGFQVVELEGTRYKEMIDIDGTRRETDMLAFDPETKKMYVIDVTLRAPKSDKIDDIANLQYALQRKGVFVEPIVITSDYAGETKKNIRKVKVRDREDLENIINQIRAGYVKEAKMILTR